MVIVNYLDDIITIEDTLGGFKSIESSVEELKKDSGYYTAQEMTLNEGEKITVYKESGMNSYEKALIDRLENNKSNDILFVVPKSVAMMFAELQPDFNVAYPNFIDHDLCELIIPDK